MAEPVQLSAAMCAIVEMAERRGVSRLCDMPGCWEVRVDGYWWFACNGHRTPTKCSKDVEVPPFGVYVEFNGWPAGSFDSFGGVIAAGPAANEDTFIAAVKAAK